MSKFGIIFLKSFYTSVLLVPQCVKNCWKNLVSQLVTAISKVYETLWEKIHLLQFISKGPKIHIWDPYDYIIKI